MVQGVHLEALSSNLSNTNNNKKILLFSWRMMLFFHGYMLLSTERFPMPAVFHLGVLDLAHNSLESFSFYHD
jgi:hypothetical protein